MYKINDKKEAVRKIQIYLSRGNHAVIPTGVYDAATKRSVKEFQKEYGLAESGVVDSNTYNAIYREFLRQKLKSDAKELSHGIDFPVKFGDYGDKIYALNSLLSRIALRYGESNYINGSFFGHESERITQRLREIFRLGSAPTVDEKLYMRLLGASRFYNEEKK